MFKKILVPLDGSKLAENAIPHAVSLATTSGATLLLARAMLLPVVSPAAWTTIDIAKIREQEEKAIKKYLDDLAAGLKEKGHTVEVVALEGEAADVLLDVAEKERVDLIVMTSHGRTGLNRWLFGSVAEKVVRHAHCPVLTVGSKFLKKHAQAESETVAGKA